MAVFAKSETQVRKVMRILSPHIESAGTNRNYAQALKVFCDWLKQTVGKRVSLKDATLQQAQEYLKYRSSTVSQKTLDLDRQAIQKMMQVVGTISKEDKIKDPETGKVQVSQIKTVLKPRSYTHKQMQAICEHQREDYALATQIAEHAGLRAHELLTIARPEEQPPIYRPNKDSERLYGQFRFEGREQDIIYTVKGKGGHIRQVALSPELAARLEARRLPEERKVRSRNCDYTQRYDLPGAKRWTNSFNKASNAAIGWSNGGHGLRHSYAQNRMKELQYLGHTFTEALHIVSLEMGHYRPDITLTYLR